jgi:hypothetical protein
MILALSGPGFRANLSISGNLMGDWRGITASEYRQRYKEKCGVPLAYVCRIFRRDL